MTCLCIYAEISIMGDGSWDSKMRTLGSCFVIFRDHLVNYFFPPNLKWALIWPERVNVTSKNPLCSPRD